MRVHATQLRYIGKETDRKWEQGGDFSLMNFKPAQFVHAELPGCSHQSGRRCITSTASACSVLGLGQLRRLRSARSPQLRNKQFSIPFPSPRSRIRHAGHASDVVGMRATTASTISTADSIEPCTTSDNPIRPSNSSPKSWGSQPTTTTRAPTAPMENAS
jgi:hypothetical protein